MPVSGPMPEELRTYRLLNLGLTLTEIEDAAACRLDELLAIDEIVKETSSGGTKQPHGSRR